MSVNRPVGEIGRGGSGSRRRTGAFTLVEILVVLAVIAILAGAVAPRFAGTYRVMQISSAARRLGDMMAFCYNAAATQQTDYRLHVDPEVARVWVTREVVLETGEREYQLVQFPGMGSYVLPDSVAFDVEAMPDLLNLGESGEYYIQFRGDGTADFTRLRLLSIRAEPRDIDLNGLTGRVIIREVSLAELQEEGLE